MTRRQIPIRCSSPRLWPPRCASSANTTWCWSAARRATGARAKPAACWPKSWACRCISFAESIRARKRARHGQGQAPDRRRLGTDRGCHTAGRDHYESRQERAADSQDPRRDAVVSQTADQVDARRAGHRPGQRARYYEVAELFIPRKETQCEFIEGDTLEAKIDAFAERISSIIRVDVSLTTLSNTSRYPRGGRRLLFAGDARIGSRGPGRAGRGPPTGR